MAELETYQTIAEKNKFFRTSLLVANNTINDIDAFNAWYARYEKRVRDRQELDQMDKELFFFRGVSEAKHKLYNSAQRIWLKKDVNKWNKKIDYSEFLKKFIESAKKDNLFQRVFDFYDVNHDGQDFPILSILQHYGCPTPLMDWTLDIDVALFFAVAEIPAQNVLYETDDYFSVYIIDNKRSRIKSIASIADSEYRSLEYVMQGVNLNETITDNLFYLSDYEINNTVRRKPLTTIYNQNIIPQKGLFIFNPLPDVPLEKYFNKQEKGHPPFRCFNIKKDLEEYIRRKIASKGIDKSLIYPDIHNNTNNILQQALNSYFI